MPRMLRTYSRRGGYLRALPQPDRWISPPQDRRRLFSSSSAASSVLSSNLSSAPSAASDDPDFSPPRVRRQKPLGERPARPRYLRSRRGAEKENRAPAALSSPSPSPLPRCARRRRKGSPSAASRPLLCSTPHWAPPCGAARPARRTAAPLPELSTSLECGSALQCSPELFSSHDASLGSAANSPGASRGASERLPLSPRTRSGRDGGTGAPRAAAPGESSAPGLRSQAALGVPRASVREPPHGATAVALLDGEPQLSALRGAAGSEGPRGDVKGDATTGSPGSHGGTAERRLMPVVVLDRGEVPLWLSSRKAASPLGREGAAKYQHKSTKLIPGEGSTCRRACISGFSASRWGRQPRLRPSRHKNKRQQQAGTSFLRPQLRRRGRNKGVQMSVGTQDSDCSFLSNSHHWGRFQASLSFHKKKKVISDDSSYASILCNPFVTSQLSGHQATLSSSKAESYALSASSVALLAPMSSSSVLEVTLTDAEKVFRECQQEGPITFEDCIPLDKMKNCKKIGEGVFGEVFQIDSERGPVALKIIPIEGTERVNGEAQKSFGEILPEIIISKELSLLSEESTNRTVGFISLYSVHCVQGAYPKYLLKAWDTYNKVTGSENDRPDLFGEEQLFMVLEFEFGGSDLENMRKKLSTVASAKSILHQVTASLAVAEQELHFEHRDLHWGNVLVKKTDVKELNYVLNGTTCTIPTAGIHVNIIDYTLSRLEKDGITVFCDLSTDEELFQGTGDYQFDIYRQMKVENSNSWTDYHPHSNVLWLHYLSDKLLKDVVYKHKESSSAMRKIKQQLTKFHKEVLTFGSASEVLDSSSLFQ